MSECSSSKDVRLTCKSDLRCPDQATHTRSFAPCRKDTPEPVSFRQPSWSWSTYAPTEMSPGMEWEATTNPGHPGTNHLLLRARGLGAGRNEWQGWT